MKRKPSRIYEGLSDEDFVTLLKSTKKKHHRIIFMLAFGSGLRVAEIATLLPEDINLKERKIHVRQGKGSKDRITITPKWLRETHIKFFPINITVRAMESAFQRNSIKAGINRVIATFDRRDSRTKEVKQVPIYKYHFHCLRHGFAKRLLKSGVPVNNLQMFMGHSNLATTSRYSKADPVDAVNDIIERAL